MAQSIPTLGYPCIAATGEEGATLVGLQFDGSATNSSYVLQSYTFSTNKNITFTPSARQTPLHAQPRASSRMVCAGDKASGSFLYIFNENIYIENSQNAALATSAPISTWSAARSGVPQVAWATTIPGQFQWLGLSEGNWTQFDIDAKGVSAASKASVPADIPTADVQTILREPSGNFLVIYTNAGNTAASRFTLGVPTSTVIALGSHGEKKVDFSTVTHAQGNGSGYFFGTSGGKDTYTGAANLTSLDLISTRTVPSDTHGNVPKLSMYGAATMSSNGGYAYVYGGLSDASTNTWDFGFTNITIAAFSFLSGYATTASTQMGTGAFTTLAPVTPRPIEEPSKGLSTIAIIGIAVGAVAILLIVGLFAIFHRRNKKIKARAKEQEGLDLAVRDMQAKNSQSMNTYQPRFASTHSLLASEANTTPRGQNSVSTEPPVENLTLRVPIVRYDGRDVAQSSPFAPLGAVVLSQYRLGQTAVNSKMVVIQLGENVDTAESVTLKWVRDEIVWQREAAMLNHIVNPAKIISLHQTMIIPAALEWRHILVLDAHELTLDFMLSTAQHRLLNRDDQRAVAKALLSGLVWCHEKDVVHLSICTGSIVMNEEGQWVLWSFGGSRFLNEAVGPRQGSQIGQENGAVERNLAPELLNARREKRLDTTLSTTMMDAWAAGCVLFEILTGQPLFRTEDAAEQAASGRFNAWKDRLVDIGDEKERRVVEGLLVLDPNYRLSLTQAESLFM
ncbi:kinase-like domain-containing protein [Linnemannia elongata]|nr:kinase-like domain-containing protein [Linnemannia elongata]